MLKAKTDLAAYEADIIARAIEFTATIFGGPGRYLTTRHPTLQEARSGADALTKQATNGRTAMVYAVSPEGRSVLVPASYQPAIPANTQEPTMSQTNLTGIEISKLTAALMGGGYKRANSKETAMKRFFAAAAEKGIKNAAAILGKPFDEALATLKPATAAEKAPKAAKSKAAKAPRAPKAEKPASGQRAAILAAAQAGKLPEPPDFSAKTHERFRGKLEKLVEMAKTGDLKGLKAMEINPVSSSPRALARYRDLCLIAIQAKAKAA